MTVRGIWLQAFTQRNFAYIVKPYAGMGSIILSARSNQLPVPIRITMPYAEIGVKTEHTVVNLYVGIRIHSKFFVHKNPFVQTNDIGPEKNPKFRSKIVFRIEHPLVSIGLK